MKINSLEGSLFVYALSFALLLAIAPGITVFVVSFEFLNLDVQQLMVFTSRFLPAEYILPFVEFLMNKSDVSQLASFISMGFSLYLASRCIYSFLMIAAKEEQVDYPKWSLRIYSVFWFLLIYLYGMGIVAFATFFSKFHLFIFEICSWGLVAYGFYLFYHYCSFVRRSILYGVVGSLFTSVSIYLVSLLFFNMVNMVTDYDSIYGPLASFMILLLSVFVISSIIYYGYLLNDMIEFNQRGYRKNLFFHFCEKVEMKMKGFGGKS